MKNRVIQIALSIGFLALLIQVVLIAPSQVRDTESKAALIPEPELAADNTSDQSLKGMHMIETKEGQKEWEIWSEKAVSLKAKEMWDVDQVKAILFSDNGLTFTVTGDKGEVQTRSKDLKVFGNVVTRSSNGYVFRTESMEYTSSTRELRAPSHVHVLGPKEPASGQAMKLAGIGMIASMEKDEIQILKDVKSEKPLEKDRKAFIRSQTAVLSATTRTVTFGGNVVLDVDNMRITGPQARFDYDSKKEMVRSAVFSGGARVSDTEKWGTAQNLEVDFLTDKYVFKGSPRVVQNNDELRGEEIVFLQGGKQVQVKRARAMVDEKHLERNQR